MKLFSLILLICSMQAFALDVKTYIPKNAFTYIPVVNAELDNTLPTFQYREYFGGLIEQESCISLTHSKCWSRLSELKTSREQGVGLSQLTRAYNADGSIRFDIIADLKKMHQRELKDLSWDTIKQRPDLQIRSMLLLYKQNYDSLYQVNDNYQRTAMADAAYNGGLGGLNKERRACSLAAKCDAQQWFGNIELTCLKSKKPLYGNRNACDINREHTATTLKIRMPKYNQYLNPAFNTIPETPE